MYRKRITKTLTKEIITDFLPQFFKVHNEKQIFHFHLMNDEPKVEIFKNKNVSLYKIK